MCKLCSIADVLPIKSINRIVSFMKNISKYCSHARGIYWNRPSVIVILMCDDWFFCTFSTLNQWSVTLCVYANVFFIDFHHEPLYCNRKLRISFVKKLSSVCNWNTCGNYCFIKKKYNFRGFSEKHSKASKMNWREKSWK